MYLYLVILGLLSIGLFLEIFFSKRFEKLWFFLWLILSIFLICRYGQGSDYVSYQLIYEQLSHMNSLNDLNGVIIHTEIGWNILCIMANSLSMQFFQFVSILSIVESLLLYRFIKLYCPYKIFALFLVFPTMYLTYMFSALRQGLVICIFLGWLFPLLLQRKYIWYWIGCCICVSIHTAGIILFFFPLVISIKRLDLLHGFAIISIIIGGIIWATGLGNQILSLFHSHIDRYYSGSIGTIPLIERVVSYIIISWLFVKYKTAVPNASNINLLNTLLKLYIFGVIIYGVWLWIPLTASRLSYACKVLEIALVCQMMNLVQLRKIIYVYFIPLVLVMYFKNMNSYIEQGGYSLSVTAIKFPYVSIFNRSDILKWRTMRNIPRTIVD